MHVFLFLINPNWLGSLSSLFPSIHQSLSLLIFGYSTKPFLISNENNNNKPSLLSFKCVPTVNINWIWFLVKIIATTFKIRSLTVWSTTFARISLSNPSLYFRVWMNLCRTSIISSSLYNYNSNVYSCYLWIISSRPPIIYEALFLDRPNI